MFIKYNIQNQWFRNTFFLLVYLYLVFSMHMYECCCQYTLNATTFFQVATHLSLIIFQYNKNLFVAFGFSVELSTLSEGRWGWKLWLSNNLNNFKDENWGDIFSWHSWYEEAKMILDASFAYYLSTK